MRIILFTMLLALVSQTALQAQEEKTAMDTLSYSLGVLMAQNLKSQGFEDLDGASMAQAIEDVLAERPTSVSVEEANENIQTYMNGKQAAQYSEVKTAGEEFLQANGLRGDVVTTDSGLQYEVLHPGSGAKPGPDDKVTVHYHGTLIDGTVFDSSVERNSPATFGVTQVIKGWVEGLQLMSTGAKYKFFIPQDLAYGGQGAGPKISPFSALIFEVELIKIN